MDWIGFSWHWRLKWVQGSSPLKLFFCEWAHVTPPITRRPHMLWWPREGTEALYGIKVGNTRVLIRILFLYHPHYTCAYVLVLYLLLKKAMIFPGCVNLRYMANSISTAVYPLMRISHGAMPRSLFLSTALVINNDRVARNSREWILSFRRQIRTILPIVM
jgi:hypothetical protein